MILPVTIQPAATIIMKCLSRLCILLVSLFTTCPALAQTQNPSIMFQQPEENQDLTQTSPTDSDMVSRCAEMARQIELLKGKPQRRYIAIKRYDLECKGGSIDYDRYDNEGISR